MPGLIDSSEGLAYAVGQGLTFEQGIGSGGLDNVLRSIPLFAGQGSLSARAVLIQGARVGFAGSSGLQR